MFKTELMQAVYAHWALDPKQENELFNPENVVLKQSSFTKFFKNAQKLMIAGDYDADGVMATSIAVRMAQKLQINYGYYIPNRLKEGYGLSEKTVDLAHTKGYTDLLLVDNGVKSQKALQKALDFGMNVAVVDHHLIEEELLENVVWIHPELIEDDYFKDMSAGGLMYALAESMDLSDPYLASMAAVATVADVMPLWGKNREIVKKGIEALNRYQFPQFHLLVNTRYLKTYTAEVLAFQISPKINAMGRLSDIANINTAVQYFVSEEPRLIQDFSKQVLLLNEKRKTMSKKQEKIAFALVDDNPVQVIQHPHFHEGLLGIIANKVSEKTGKPSILLKPYENIFKGSARSMSYSLTEIFKHVSPSYFEQMGGHDFAYGMTLKKTAMDDFKNDVNEAVKKIEPIEKHVDSLLVNPHWLTREAVEELSFFEPFGEGFRIPLFEMVLPENFEVKVINGHGFKLRFDHFEAVYFGSQYDEEAMRSARHMLCRLDMQSKYGLQVYVEAIR